MPVTIGLTFGQRCKPTALCAVEGKWRKTLASRRREGHFVVRFVERLPAGTSFPIAAERLGKVARAVIARAGRRPSVFVDATGLGSPVVELLETKVPWVMPIFFNHGDRRVEDGMRSVTLGKAWLVARLQTLLQARRLHLPEGETFRVLAKDLLDFEVNVRPDANEHYGSFPVGGQDDVVTALGLAVQLDPPVAMRKYFYAVS